MVRLVVKETTYTKKTRAPMRLDYQVLLKYADHSRFNSEHDQEGMGDHFKRKKNFTLLVTSFNFCITINSNSGTGNEIFHELQLLTR